MAKLMVFITLGVVFIGASLADQSEETSLDSDAITALGEKVRRQDIPEVVLQLKYDGGELNKIYLTQFRKNVKTWSPSVVARGNLCADLCHAVFYVWDCNREKGLGGDACGSTCKQLIPVGLKTALQEGNSTSEEMYGQPRYSVCPALCSNHLGEPLCNCAEQEVDLAINWSSVCTAFCYEGYTLNGCSTCETTATLPTSEPPNSITSGRTLDTSEGWAAWCNTQCQQGQGGAACNCGRTPFQ